MEGGGWPTNEQTASFNAVWCGGGPKVPITTIRSPTQMCAWHDMTYRIRWRLMPLWKSSSAVEGGDDGTMRFYSLLSMETCLAWHSNAFLLGPPTLLGCSVGFLGKEEKLTRLPLMAYCVRPVWLLLQGLPNYVRYTHLCLSTTRTSKLAFDVTRWENWVCVMSSLVNIHFH